VIGSETPLDPQSRASDTPARWWPCGSSPVGVGYGLSAAVLSVASGTEVDEGRGGRSGGQIRSVRVRCKSAWLLH
jgi:hypothetical protein